MTGRTAAALALLGVGLGVILGHLVWPAPSHASVALPQSPTRRLVCTNVATPVESTPDCGEAEARLQWCEGRLAAATRVKPTGRREWPAAPAEEQPDVWTERMDQLVRACGLPLSIEVSDCDEYPCVAATRVTDPALTAKDIRKAVEACPQAKEILGDLNFEAVKTRVTCPDGSIEPATVLFAMGSTGSDNPVMRELFDGQEPDLADVIVFGGRRVESSLQTWQCQGAAP